MGALLPLVSEFPLSLPGYYYQEISAREFVLLGGNYLVPIDEKERWNVNVTATTAAVNYIQGLEQPGHWHSGAGAGILYKTPSWKVMVGYAYVWVKGDLDWDRPEPTIPIIHATGQTSGILSDRKS